MIKDWEYCYVARECFHFNKIESDLDQMQFAQFEEIMEALSK